MNTKEWVEKLNNIEYPAVEIWDMRKELENNGIVVVYGASDDLIEIEGAIQDEGDCYKDRKFYLNKDGLTDKSEYYIKVTHPHNGTVQFEYDTNIPNVEWFNVVEEGDLYCKGFVFNKNDLK